ncbi:MAG: hypothetical protein C0615_09580 [Desulfuromonas sp.]|nr:MAG: hypothetical protein C0615_09580 [Desulfuromonas sp.]
MNKADLSSKLFIQIITLTTLVLLTASSSLAARISFNPNRIGVAVTAGQAKEIVLSTTLSETVRPTAFANLSIVPAGGNINRAWVVGSAPITLDSRTPTAEATVKIDVPVGAQSGTYTAILSPAISRTSERTMTDQVSLYVEVLPDVGCSQPPSITVTSSNPTTIKPGNNKNASLSFSGSVSSLDGCTTGRTWYQLADEYGEQDASGTLELDAFGNFEVSIPIVASRKGADRDGRTLAISFGAENEAGITIGDQQVVTVSHDNRKK